MKKLWILIAALCLFISTISAQGITVGPKVSLGSSGLRGDDYDSYLDYYSIESKFALGLSVGGFALFDITPMTGIEVDLLYSTLTAKYGDSSYWLQETYSALSFPVYGRFSFQAGNLKPYVLAGLDLNILFGDVKYKDSEGDSDSESVKDNADSTFLFGLGLGAGISVTAGSGSLDLGVRYRTNLNEMVTDAKMYFQSFGIDIAYGLKIR
jgi:opacity protein-like surface antigen